MKEHLCKHGQFQGEIRYILTEKEELQEADWARNYFGGANTFIFEGLGRKRLYQGQKGHAAFQGISKGSTTFSMKEIRLIKEYAKRWKKGDRYDSETFMIPNLDMPEIQA